MTDEYGASIKQTEENWRTWRQNLSSANLSTKCPHRLAQDCTQVSCQQWQAGN